ncbi:hypothetical protein SAMN05421736_10894 [Evansella caseinilytica]|uniref:Uncharacterized protein n=1 Tax=Evansella caseinilytica TaxID=1503961 RepID=A0A1H3RGT8_9BACI|nr:hypothetical protein [Evansella caseinilytica]SDZ24793.1 hypothetical protein SAMN05421736_10894 [Evansella caseinilytica]
MWKKKARFYIPLYIVGYLVSLHITGVPSLIYLVPVKGLAVFIMVATGSGLYRVIEEKENFLIAGVKGIMSMLLGFFILLLFGLLQSILLKYGIDITPIVGLPID